MLAGEPSDRTQNYAGWRVTDRSYTAGNTNTPQTQSYFSHFLIQLSLRKSWFDSTHDSRWLYKNWLKSAHDLKWIGEIWFKSTHDSKIFRNILILINSRLKNFPKFWFKSTYDSKSSHDSIKEYWLKSSHASMIRINCWLRWHFLGFHSLSLTFFGLSLTFVDLFWAFD